MADVNCYLPIPRPGFVTAPITSSIGNNWYIYRGTARLFPARPALTTIIEPGSPVDVNRNHKAYISFNVADRFYNRIIVTPLVVNVGNIASNVDIEVSVWNAYFSAKNLLSITINDSNGIELTGPQVPLMFGRLTMNKWSIKVLSEGAPEINYAVTFNFFGLQPVTMYITGRRAVPWLFSPDWSDGFSETLSWYTQVMTSQTGTEQRRAMRLSPRQTFEFDVIAEGATRQRFEQMIYRYGARVWAVPVYFDKQILDNFVPSGSDSLPLKTPGYHLQPSGLLMLQNGPNNELLQIASILGDRVTLSKPTENAWAINTIVYPIKTALLTDPPQIRRLNDGIIKARVRLAMNQHNGYSDEITLEQYRNKPVMPFSSDWSKDLTTETQRFTKTLDNKTGLMTVTDTAGRAFTLQQHNFVVYGRAEHDRLRRLLYQLQGRLKPIWLSSQASDFTLVNNISGTTLDVINNGYSIESGRQDICIELAGQRRYYRRIMQITELNNDVLRLGLDGDVITASVHEVLKISLMTLARLNSDDVNIEHLTDADGVTTVTATFRGLRDELE